MEVQILSRKFITPSSPPPPHLQNIKLSSLDQIASPMYVSCIFYYPASEEEHSAKNAERSEQLQKSLSETLTLFYPLAGRWNEDNPSIDYNDKGANYLEAQASGCLSQLLREGELKKELQNHLIPADIYQSEKLPMVMVQFNTFECGGVAIGICVSHKIADAFTILTFVNSWGVATRIGIDKVDCPSFPLASFCPPRDMPISASMKNFVQSLRDSSISMKRFVFNGGAISNLKAIANADANSSELLKHQPTRVEVVTALIWKALIKVSQARHGCLRPSLLALSVNMRGKTILPLPKNCCGNFVDLAIANFMPDNDSDVHLHDLVGLVHDAIKSNVTNYAKASNGDDVFLMVDNSMRKMTESLGKSDVDFYTFTSWSRFPVYEVDFGWGKPAWVTSVQTGVDNYGMLLDTKDGDGIEAWLCLDENNMLLFQQNLDITALTGQALQLGLGN